MKHPRADSHRPELPPPSPEEAVLVEQALVQRLKHCYWPKHIFGMYTLEMVRGTPPQRQFRDKGWRMRRTLNVLAYDFGRVHFFMQRLKQGAKLDPIDVETSVYPTRGGPPAWGIPHIEDGHHRFAAAVLAKCLRIPMRFGGVLTTRDWLVGKRRRKPPEIP